MTGDPPAIATPQLKPSKENRDCPTTNRRNKRKSLEPRKLHSLTNPDWKRRRLNSTGSEDRSPQNVSISRSPSPTSVKSITEPATPPSPQLPQHLAPKKRFKLDALRELQRLQQLEEEEDRMDGTDHRDRMDEAEQSGARDRLSLDPFRPWSKPTAVLQTDPSNVSCLPLLLGGAQAGLPLALLPGVVAGLLPTPNKLNLVQEKANDPVQEQPLLDQPVQEQPLALIKKKNCRSGSDINSDKQKQVTTDRRTGNASQTKIRLASSATSESDGVDPLEPTADERSRQRNYKNLTRERRIEANARERQRVHTITAAFDTLQAAIPTEDDTNKLSKLSVIKIATAYIMALSRMAGYDYTEDKSAPSVEAVVEACRRTISVETRAKRRN